MPFNEDLPAENTNPWYTPFVVNFVGGLRTFVNNLEAIVSGKANAADLGSAAAASVGDFATAAQGALADSAVQPAALEDYVETDDPRLSDARTPTAHTHEQSDVTGLGAALAAKANVGDLVVLGVIDHDETPPSSGVWLRRPAPEE